MRTTHCKQKKESLVALTHVLLIARLHVYDLLLRVRSFGTIPE